MKWRSDILGLVVVTVFCALCIHLFRGGTIDQSLRDVALVLIGQLSAKFSTIVDYHFGSSAGSAAKDEAKKP